MKAYRLALMCAVLLGTGCVGTAQIINPVINAQANTTVSTQGSAVPAVQGQGSPTPQPSMVTFPPINLGDLSKATPNPMATPTPQIVFVPNPATGQGTPPTLVNNGTINIVQQNVIQQSVNVTNTNQVSLPAAASAPSYTTFEQPEFRLAYPSNFQPLSLSVQMVTSGTRLAFAGGGETLSVRVVPFSGDIQAARAVVEGESGLQNIQDRLDVLGGSSAYEVRDFFPSSGGGLAFGSVIVAVHGGYAAELIYTAEPNVLTKSANDGVAIMENMAASWVWYVSDSATTAPTVPLPPTPEPGVPITPAPTPTPTPVPTPTPISTPTSTPTPTPIASPM